MIPTRIGIAALVVFMLYLIKVTIERSVPLEISYIVIEGD